MRRFLIIIALTMALSASAQKWQPINAEFDSLVLRCEYTRNNLQLPSESEIWIKRMHELADKHRSQVMQWRTLYFESWFRGRLGDHGTEAQLLDKALQMVDSVKYRYDYQRLLWNRGLLENWGNFVESYKTIRCQMPYYKEIGDDLMVGLMYLNLARVFDQVHMYEKAQQYDKESEKYYRKIGYIGAIEHGKIDEINRTFYMGHNEEGHRLYKEALKNPYILEDTVAYYALLTAGHSKRIDLEASFRAYDLAKEYGKMPSMLRVALINLGSTHLDTGKPKEAIDYYRGALRYDLHGDIYDVGPTMAALSGLYHSYQRLERFDSAFIFQNRYLEIRDSLEALNNQDQFMADMEKQLILQEEAKFDIERRQARVRLTAICLISLAIILIALAAAWRHRMRRRLKETENELLASEAEKERLEKELYQQQCEDRERELTTNSLLLVEKKKMMQSLNKQIEEYSHDGKIDKDATSQLQAFIKIHNNNSESLQQFYAYFNQVHPEFLKSLKEAFPKLTQNELRLCAYIRMGLDTKQIAQVTSAEWESVRKARHRLRKKLPLEATDSLADFLMLWPGRVSPSVP